MWQSVKKFNFFSKNMAWNFKNVSICCPNSTQKKHFVKICKVEFNHANYHAYMVFGHTTYSCLYILLSEFLVLLIIEECL